MTTQLYEAGGTPVTVRNPDVPFERPPLFIGSHERMLDGTLRQHYATVKRTWHVTWSHLSSAELATLYTELERRVAMSWKPPDEATTYTVLVTDSPTVTVTAFGTTSVSAVLEQV